MIAQMTYRAIAGHRRVKSLLSGAVARGSIPPTLLFVGPHGVGKTLVARATAAALNCLTPVTDAEEPRNLGTSKPRNLETSKPRNLGTPEPRMLDACGACRSCDRIARDMHVDVLQLEPDDRASIKIDVTRDVLGRTAFRPFEGRRRVVIIREADALEVSAQNALLKALEEPPPSTVFILTTAVPGALLPTVRSRCMRLRFGRLTEAEVAGVLERDHALPARDARAAAALADGSVGQALAIGSADLVELRDVAVRLLEHAARSSVVAARLQAAATIVGKTERTREDVGLILRLVASMLRDIEVLNAGGDRQALANPALSDKLASLTRSYPGERARSAFGAVDRAIAALGRNAGPKVVAEWVSTQI